jgi:hypothetical protein
MRLSDTAVRAGSVISNCTGQLVFLLKDEGTGRDALAVADVAYPQLHEIARTELATDSYIEEDEISTSAGNLKSYANRPYLLEFEWCLLAYELSLVTRLARGDCSAGLHDRQGASSLRGALTMANNRYSIGGDSR